MTPAVSVPEKTLEHWSSLYLSYRYRSHAALWWPTRGEDIDLRALPGRPGKALQLELKTTTPTSRNVQDVLVDLGQLWDYSRKPLGRQPFYALPIPHWAQGLATASASSGVSPTELAYSRAGSKWWFAQWMVLLTTNQVASVLAPELAAHGCSTRNTSARLVRIDLAPRMPRRLAWGGGTTAPPAYIPWRDFWSQIDLCGQPMWPQLLRLPAGLLGRQEDYSHQEVMAAARAVAGQEIQTRQPVQLVTLSPDSDGRFRVEDDAASPPASLLRDDSATDHRTLVYLDAEALFRRS